MLPFFLRHYAPVAARIFVYDDGSTDRSLRILARERKVTIVPIRTGSESYVEALRGLYDECWKRSRGDADWVVVCNVDEHFFHPAGLLAYLDACRDAGVTMVPAEGYEMLADRFPAAGAELSRSVRRGVRAGYLDKLAVFSPDAIDEIRFEPGRHAANPAGRVVVPEVPELRLLHYKHLGVDYVRARHAELRSRRRPGDRDRSFGGHYEWDADTIVRAHAEWASRAIDVTPRRRRQAAAWLPWPRRATVVRPAPLRTSAAAGGVS